MKLDAIEVINFRKFEQLSCTLHPSLTVLVSENGGGKTTLLDAIRIAVWPFVKGFDLGTQTGKPATIAIDDVRRVLQVEGNMEPQTPSKVVVKGDWLKPDDEMIIERVQINKTTKNVLSKDVNAFTKQAKKFQQQVRDGIYVDLPLISYLGTSRVCVRGFMPRKSLVETVLEKHSRTSAYLNCLSTNSSFQDFYIWYTDIYKSYRESQLLAFEIWKNSPGSAFKQKNFLKAHLDAFSEEVTLDKIGQRLEDAIYVVKSSLDALLQEPTGWHNLEYSERQQQQLVMSHDDFGVLPIAMLSDGLRNAIAMVADIAFRAYKLNPHMRKEAAKQTTGIVMIDEVDMFLHPKWQQTILPSLKAAFPKIQFIVTTHSPQVLSTVKRENIRVIKVNAEGKTEAEMPEFHPLGHESGDSLSHIMGTPTRPLLAFDEQIVKYEQLVRSGQEDSVDAKTIKKELDDVGYMFKEADLKTWQFLASRKRT